MLPVRLIAEALPATIMLQRHDEPGSAAELLVALFGAGIN
jgi:hypothetical protein